MAKEWASPIYGFFQACPTIKVIEGRHCHEFQCDALLCKGKGTMPQIVRRYLDKGDQNLTSNMQKISGEMKTLVKPSRRKGNLALKMSEKILGVPNSSMYH